MIAFDADGKEISFEHPDSFSVPHVYTFGSIMAGGWNTYVHEQYDEAMRHRRENGLAMYRDLYLQSLLRERTNGTMRFKWHIETDNPKDPTEKATSDSLTKIIRGIRRLRRLRRWTLRGGLWYGRYAAQVEWGWATMNLPTPEYSGPAEAGTPPSVNLRPQRVMTIKDMRPVNGDKIGYQFDGTPYILAGAAQAFASRYNFPMIVTTGGMGILLKDPRLRRQFIIHNYDPDDADYFEPEMAGGIFGVGIRSRIYWFDWMRREYLSWITDILNRFPIVLIFYDANNNEAKAIALKTAKKYDRRSAIVMPRTPDRTMQHGAIEVIDAPVAGTAAILELVKHIEAHEERFIVGQAMSGGNDASDGLGGNGRAMFAADTKQDLIADDAEDHGETLTGGEIDTEPGLVNMLLRWSKPDLYGKFPARWVHDVDEANPIAKLGAIGAAAQIGVTFPESEVRSITGIRAPEDGEPVVGGQQGGGAPGEEPDLDALLNGAGDNPEQPPGMGKGMNGGGMNGGKPNGKPPAFAGR